MQIAGVRYYGCSRTSLCRLALAKPFLKLQEVILDAAVEFPSSATRTPFSALKNRLFDSLAELEMWSRCRSTSRKSFRSVGSGVNFRTVLEVVFRFSRQRDLVVRDVIHLRNSLQEGEIDVGVIVVPSDRMQKLLPDRTPSFSDAERYIEREFPEATKYPIVVIAVEHDGPAVTAIPKRKRSKSE